MKRTPPTSGSISRAASAWGAVLLGCLSTCLWGCAGYQIGNQGLYPAHIETVYVPIFESASFRRNVGEWLTEAVAKEIELKTPYKVVGTPDADSILSGRIESDTRNTTIMAATGDQRQAAVNLVLKVSWVDRRGNLLRDGPPIPLDCATVNVTGTAYVAPEVGQSNTTARMQAIQRLAEQVVSLMEAPW